MAALWKPAAARRLPVASAVWVPVPWCGMKWPACESAPGRTTSHRAIFHRFAELCRFRRALAGGRQRHCCPGQPAVLPQKALDFAIEKGAAGAGCACAGGTFCQKMQLFAWTVSARCPAVPPASRPAAQPPSQPARKPFSPWPAPVRVRWLPGRPH